MNIFIFSVAGTTTIPLALSFPKDSRILSDLSLEKEGNISLYIHYFKKE